MLATRTTLYGPRVTLPVGLDEMVDGRGGLRPHWRGLLGAFSTLGEGGLQEAARRVDRAFEDEGVTSILPGVERLAWRCDPIPLPLLANEFQDLATGLAQRATLLAALLGDLYGRQSLLSDGVLPPALVYPNPGFMRACRASVGGPAWPQRMEFYAADLIRGPDGRWMVLADRTAGAAGIAIARENRRNHRILQVQRIVVIRGDLVALGVEQPHHQIELRAAIKLLGKPHGIHFN